MASRDKLTRYLPVISFVLFAVAIAIVHHEINAYRWNDIRRTLMDFPAGLMAVCTGITLMGYIALSFYDFLALRYTRENLPYRRVLLTSFLSYAISNNIGHAWISGGSMRYRLYSGWGLPGISIAKIVMFCSITYVIGALTIMVGSYVFIPDHILLTDKLPHITVSAVIWAGAVLLAAWWGLVIGYRRPVTIKGISVSFPEFTLAVYQLLIALLDLLLASLVMYIPLSHFTAMSFADFLVLYIMAQLMGLVSMVPGGIGIFEGSFLFLASGRYPASDILASLIIYRAVYYFLPLLLAGITLAAYELRSHWSIPAQRVSIVLNTIESTIPRIFSVLLMLGGGVLLFSGSTPAMKDRLEWLEYFIPVPVLEFSHLLGSVAGVALLFLSQAVRRKIDAAYFATIAMLLLGIIASLIKGLDYEEAIILSVMLLSFIPARKYFYRQSALMQLELPPRWYLLAAIVLFGSVWLGFFSFKHVEYSQELWWQFSLHGDASRFLRSLVAILVIVTGFAGYRLLTRSAYIIALPERGALDKACVIAGQSNETYAHLALTGDKYLLWSSSGNSFLMYDITSNYWAVMGDPVGLAEEFEELVWSLRTIADRHNAKIAFYQVGTHNLSLYLDLGLALIKLGEEARVPLETFSLEGKGRSGIRQTYNKLKRRDLFFEIISAADIITILPELQEISNLWLAHKQAREKRFSLGFFSADYMRRCPVAVIRQEGHIIAFANIWETENKHELSIDLMRYKPGAPNGTMEFLTVSLILWGKDQGYKWFNLGMAPLSGLEHHPLAPIWNKIGNTVFRFGHEFYNFEGLYHYKNKFDPVWRPRYLAAPKGFSTASALLSITMLISENIEDVFAK